jgi:hypothetical protein
MSKRKVLFSYDKIREELHFYGNEQRPTAVYGTIHPNAIVNAFLREKGVMKEHDFFKEPQMSCEIEE